ncbi:hypothetical protein P152DRAFT_479840 [Eremomyces bilateralis CBS 781.70]|uniref:Uncharacterized protein n=1 Tax=Eremomyces bilateralis CBS 781.70 TaxID=1392243 RepID=A0A6G1G9C8_9PEZI|nr:uncharacterized protein P152DRAFT_479840 [Eremomyces bilateralis CBS 781.70]KAF1814688.1 hypothetical protein P152DRAFT_479840 [Eremomyces bilateralis CBS 781.70]
MGSSIGQGEKTLSLGEKESKRNGIAASPQVTVDSDGSPLPFRIRKHILTTRRDTAALPRDNQTAKPRSVDEAKPEIPTPPTEKAPPVPEAPRPKSLFAELFPEEVEESTSPLRGDDLEPSFSVSHIFGGYPDETPKAVMVMRGLSPHLHLDDFQRCVPEGKHIPGWTSQGQFTKVIPERHPVTTERTCNYYLLFPTSDDLRAYERRVTELHKLTVQHTPTSLLSRITPPPGYRINDVDIHHVLQNFTLVPPTQKVHIRALNMDTLRPNQRFFLEHGETHYLVAARRRKIPTVLFGVTEGRQPSPKTILNAIRDDGARRGVPWELVEEGENISAIDVMKPAEWGRRRVTSATDGGDAGENEGWRAGGDELQTEGRRHRSPLSIKWLIHFKTERDAVGFARRWNRRAFPWPQRAGTYSQQRGMDELLSQVTAEAVV